MKPVTLYNPKVALISDLHLGIHQNNAAWHTIAFEWAIWLASELKRQNVSDIIFCGDFFHYRDDLSVNTIHFASKLLDIWEEFNLIFLVGNHDAYYKDRSEVNSLSLLSKWNNITVISETTTTKLFGKTVTFVPWGVEVGAIPKSDIVFGHFEIQSFRFNQFTVCSTGITSEEILEKSPFIITGHLHLRDYREYTNGSKILYVGNPFQMDFGDMDSTKGYYLLDFETLKLEFIENKLSPKHFKVSLANLAAIGQVTDSIREKFKNNFIKLIIDRSISSTETDFLIQKLAELKPAMLTVDYAFTFDKFKIDDNNVDLSGVDVTVAISEFVQLLDLPYKQEIADYTIDLYKRCK